MSILGKIAYSYFFKPILSPLKDYNGIAGLIKVKLGQYQMRKASEKLVVPDFKDLRQTATICGIAGKNNWYQMIFCLYSFYNAIGFNMQTVIIDDGTLDDEFHHIIKKQLPYVTIIVHTEAHSKTSEFFTKESYPEISDVFSKFVVFKKIFHARILIDSPVLVLDADMLFFRKPSELINWIENPGIPIYMFDKFSIYGNQTPLLLEKNLIKSNVNSGIIGLVSKAINWHIIEKCLEKYKELGAVNYLTEQALYAMYFSHIEAYPLPEETYIILPDKEESISPKAIMHHYPTENRNYYYAYAWKTLLKS